MDFEADGPGSFTARSVHLTNYYLGGTLIWQKGIIKKCLRESFDHAIITADMWCVSNWIAALVCRFRGIRVSFWGHGLYGGENFLKLRVRIIFLGIADSLLLYERRAKKLLIKKGFDPNKMYVVFNSLNYSLHREQRESFPVLGKKLYAETFYHRLPTLVFIGRLTAAKRLDLLIDAVLQINATDVRVNLMIVGDGSARDMLDQRALKGLSDGYIKFFGACYDERTSAMLIAGADLCVSPGNVGLTAIHALSLGTPVATHSNFENQMPEVESITDGRNGFLFREGDVQDLAGRILLWVGARNHDEDVRKSCYEVIDNFYNPDYQLSVFMRCLSGEGPQI